MAANSEIDVEVLTEHCRYSENLDALLNRLGIKKVLRLEYECDYQGYVDIDALLEDGRVFSYEYSYGSCSGCDDWEARDLSEEEIEKEMEVEATFFDDLEQYKKWRKKCK